MTTAAVARAASMMAVRHVRYGSPAHLVLGDVEIPPLADDRVLVRVRASSVNALDWHLMRGEPFLVRASEGLLRPRTGMLGAELAGTVEEIGVNVTEFRPGDRVFGAASGAFAEFAATKPASLAPIPQGISFEEAAAVPVAGSTALQAVRDHGRVTPGTSVLVVGAGGGVGHFAVQIAKQIGARVSAVSSARNEPMLRSIGADEVLDYATDDFTRRRQAYDAIIDIAGIRSVRAGLRALKPSGSYVVVGGPSGRWIRPMDRIVAAVLRSRVLRQRIACFIAQVTPEDLGVLRDMLEQRQIRPVIDRTFALAEVPEAVRYVEERRGHGKVVITV